ncbi:MAG TPA: alpha-galactosidase [Candidatus Limivivens merdigallinarum]|uniref:Alpha-galactosidase n=1 Tax=Candidatus Limivivens merdigallinarum TaxID=2840859 RepID=A0A9D0ZW22_9FIRM|nr:alpha-galactosidase [Candidatus Limivivens merdigallinarum]
MSIAVHENTKTFHLFNKEISYIMTVLPNGQLGQLYFGKRIHDREDFSYLLEIRQRAMASNPFEGDRKFSLEHVKQEYGVYGSTDYRYPAIEVLQKNGSRISDFQYQSYEVTDGKPKLPGLPATYTEAPEEAETLAVFLKDPVTGIALKLLYTIFEGAGAIARSVEIRNEGSEAVHLTRAMSLCMDLPDCDYEWIQFSGAWSRERHVKVRKLECGIQAIDSLRGHSSHNQNPFVILKRPDAGEERGEAIGFSLVYSGNFLTQAEVDTYDATRMLLGINPFGFDWKLEKEASFQTPEAVMVYTDKGLNHLSQTFHRLYQKRLAHGYWRDRVRPILINNWEATYFDFTEERLLEIAEKAKECGVELFVLDDGWFGKRCSDRAGLGDWVENRERLPEGIAGLAEKIEKLGMKFGLWFEPEMVNRDSDLFRAHPDWAIQTPKRAMSQGRNQYVLDFSRPEVVEAIYQMMSKILRGAKVSYVKWDMNRSITECYSLALEPERQGEVFHRYILGVYSLYERLTSEFPEVLFESCASGGARFDAGMLYYAPQAWTSDDTDAVERLKIQYGSSYGYPISSIGSHVSASPNHQLNRETPLYTRANVAYFGTFGYELDLNKLTQQEQEEVKEQIRFMKKYRETLQFGTFYRLKSPFEGNVTAWMCVSQDRKQAIVGWYRVLNEVNRSFSRIRLAGLEEEWLYELEGTGEAHYGDELMNVGLITSDAASGEVTADDRPSRDFDSRLFILNAKR